MKKLALMAVGASIATSALAGPVPPGTTANPIDPFVTATRGTLLEFGTDSGTTTTFSATFNYAVYRNTSGTLDFYYQVVRDGAGTMFNQAIQSFTASPFDGFSVFAYVDNSDFDGAGGFLLANNPGVDTSTAGRNGAGDVLSVNFGANSLDFNSTQNSGTYIFRTDATNYTQGTYGIIDGSTLNGFAFAPSSQVPEPATWMMMLAGFGFSGLALRQRRRKTALA